MDALWLLEGDSWDAVTCRERRSEVRGSNHLTCFYKREGLTLNIQGMSLRLAWITSDSRTELTENSSSLWDRKEQ